MRRAVMVAALALCAIGACASPSRDESGDTAGAVLRVFAASSLTDALDEISVAFAAAHGIRSVASYAGTSELARQIEDGAPADVFVAASKEWMAYLASRGGLDGAAATIAHNRLVCITPRGSSIARREGEDLVALFGRIHAERRQIAVADEGVPAGDYARQALAKLGVLDQLRPRLVGQKDVRAVLRAVERGGLPVGFVYATDARVADVEILFAVEPSMHEPISYHASVLRGAGNPDAARRYLEFLTGDVGRRAFAERGFEVD